MSGDLRVTMRVNGVVHDLDIAFDTLLLDLVRDRLSLTGTKLSCGEQACGACTVLVDGQPVSACSYLAYEADGRDVLTIEGLAQDGRLDPVQQAFVDAGAIQCGFCTPGMVLTAKALLAQEPRPSRERISEELTGNLCRCTGYLPIVAAVELASRRVAGDAV